MYSDKRPIITCLEKTMQQLLLNIVKTKNYV